MGKQTNFYMEREVFLKLAQTALDNGCVILRQSGKKIISSTDISIITAGCSKYYFYLPQAGELDYDLPLGMFNANANVLIEASYSTRDENSVMRRARLYLISGITDKDGSFISSPDCLVALYHKLVVRMKQLTDFVEIPADRIVSRLNYYVDPSNRSRKMRITEKINKQLSRDGGDSRGIILG